MEQVSDRSIEAKEGYYPFNAKTDDPGTFADWIKGSLADPESP